MKVTYAVKADRMEIVRYIYCGYILVFIQEKEIKEDPITSLEAEILEHAQQQGFQYSNNN